MKISWYPWQLFVRKWELVVPLSVSLVGSIALIIFMLVRLRGVTLPLFVHYSVELGVDAVGGRWLAVGVGILALVISVINITVANVFLLQEKNLARLVAWSALPLVGFGWFLGVLIVRVNGA